MSDQFKGTIGVLIEAHYDETEFRRFNEYLPSQGYAIEYISYLWGQPSLTFRGNDNTSEVTVFKDVKDVDLANYRGIIFIGGYAMDRLRYQDHPKRRQPNRAPAVEFLRRAVVAMEQGKITLGTICHSLWLFCAAPETLQNRKVTCAHNIMGDVQNAGGTVVYEGDQLIDVYVDNGLVTGRHPGVVDAFMPRFLTEIENRSQSAQLVRKPRKRVAALVS